MSKPLAGRYEILKRLGSGGFGETFLAVDHHLPGRSLCVVKQLKPLAQDDATLALAKRFFDREAELLYELGTHDQIPRLLAHFEQDSEFYLVQEWIEGRSLHEEFFSPQRWSEAELVSFLQDSLAVLAVVHHHQAIHRDIKPSNLMRRQSDRRIILIDFGAVKAVRFTHNERGEASRTVAIGSPGYMPSEQRSGRPCFSSDLYALGIVALQGFTGYAPEELPSHPDTHEYDCHLLGDRAPKSPDLCRFLDTLTRYDFRQRFRNASVALETLTALLNEPSPNNHLSIVPEATPGISPHTHVPDSQTVAPTLLPATLPPETSLPNQSQAANPQPAIPTPSLTPSLTPQSYRNRQALLNKVERFWIQGVLETSLHGQVMVNLGMEQRPDAIAHPWTLMESDNETPQQISSGTRLIDWFDQLGVGRSLLILGEPGSGKTTMLLELARILIQRAQQDVHHLIPVVFNLSAWHDETLPIADWVLSELNSKYQIPKGIGQQWLDDQQLLLLLDGFDEVQVNLREACLVALNQFHQSFSPEFIVCSRLNDYQSLHQRLQVQSAIRLRSLTDDQILAYLNALHQGATGLRTLIAQDQQKDGNENRPWLELARTPLMLNIMVLAYQDLDITAFPQSNDGYEMPDYQQQIFDAYIQRMFQRRCRNQPYTSDQTLHWLQELARNLQRTSQTVFLIERMQPQDWLNDSQSQRYRLGIWCSFWAIASGLGSLVLSLDRLLLALAIGSLIFWFIFGVNSIRPAETLKWSWRVARRNLVWGIPAGAIIGMGLKFLFGLVFGALPWGIIDAIFWEQMTQGFLYGVTLGLTYGIIRGFSHTTIDTVIFPNQGIWQSARNAVRFAAIAIIAPTIVAAIIGGTKVLFWTFSGLALGLATGGGEACIKHSILRFVLWSDRRIPWNYSRFLDYATDRAFLQKVGGGYIFIHRLLLEHIARRSPH